MQILLDHSTMKNCSMSIKLYANSNILVIGSSGSGKTTAVLKIIEEKLIEPMPKKIFYLYGAHQPFMDDMTNIEFVKGLDLSVINNYNRPKLLIIDDLILELNKKLANHFIAGSHHKQTTTIFITHSLYLNNELYRLISNNSQYILVFKNKRNFSQVLLVSTKNPKDKKEIDIPEKMIKFTKSYKKAKAVKNSKNRQTSKPIVRNGNSHYK